MSNTVDFESKELKLKILKKLGKTNGKVTKNGMQKLNTLYLKWANKLTNLKGLEYAQNLKHLEISNCPNIHDLSPISKLNNLKHLEITFCNISDISFLSKLHNLTYLDLSFNQIEDISTLSKLRNLIELHLIGNRINDITSLNGLQNLELIALQSIFNLSTIGSLPNLKKLYINRNVNILPTPNGNKTKIPYKELINKTINPNLLSDESQNLLYELVKNPCKQKALELLEQSPAVLIAGRNYFTKEELRNFFKDKFSDPNFNEAYLKEFLEIDCSSLIGLEENCATFFNNVGCKGARIFAKQWLMKDKLSK